MPGRLDYAIRGEEKQINTCIQTEPVNDCQEDDLTTRQITLTERRQPYIL